MATPTLSTAFIAAQLDAVLGRDTDGRPVAMRSGSRGAWPDTLTRGGSTFALRWCGSVLELRDALAELESADDEARRVVLLTPLSTAGAGWDVAARLARGRVFEPESWEMLRQMFQAKGTDARLARHPWMAQVLVACAQQGTFAPVPGAYLDLDTVWGEVLQRCLQMPGPRPDAVTLLAWAARADLPVLLQDLPEAAKPDLWAWLAQQAGLAGQMVVVCVEAGYAADAAALGLVCDVVFALQEQPSTEMAQAAVRLERFVGGRHIPVGQGREWAAQSRRYVEGLRPEAARAVLDRADALLIELHASASAVISDWLPAGLEQRLARLAQAIAAHAAQPTEASAAALEEAANTALRHRLTGLQRLRAERIEMARRLGRWLLQPEPAAAGLAELCERQADDAAYVDWARFRLLGGDETPLLSQAYAGLRHAVASRRDAGNRAFAAALAGAVHDAAVPGGRAVAVEQVLDRVLAPLARQLPVLLLVVDGLSVAIFRELFARMEQHGWTELMPEDQSRPLVGVAALPTVTEVSRASLLCGRLCVGPAALEKQGFASHAGLVAASSQGAGPRLFHKADLSELGELAAPLRAALANPSQKVVGAVYNAVDDHLSGPDQLHPHWEIEHLRLLLPLLREARDARRLLVVAADHGHVLEEGSSALDGDQSGRWRPGTAAAHSSEVALRGPRVLSPEGGDQVVCLWSETARYGSRRNGYHGGAAAAEVVVPLSVFAPPGVGVAAWRMAPPQRPQWWDLPAMVPVQATPAAPQRATGRRQVKRAEGQGGLFGEAELPMPSAAPRQADWVELLLASPLYASQRQLAARVAVPNPQMSTLLHALDERGGKLTRAAVAQRLGVTELQATGLLSAARRMLNLDQAPVLTLDGAAGTVELNRALLEQQFRLSPGGGAQ